MGLAIGAVADDFTGATDLASMLARGGLKTVLQLGVPDIDAPRPQAEAIVVALKSRTAPTDEAIADSLASWRWMAGGGATRCYFKYCSTFDSTPAGNIGPVAEALMTETGATQTVYTPAFPENGRSIYMGNLFVGETPLAESGMRDHPLTPMTESNLARALAPQLSPGAKTGLVDWPVVHRGGYAVAKKLAALEAEGVAHVIVDGLTQDDLDALAEAIRDWPLVTAGSGLGLSLARTLAGPAARSSEQLPIVGGPTILLSGSCSEATNAQVNRWQADGGRLVRLDPLEIVNRGEQLLAELAAELQGEPVLFAATQPPEQVKAAQAALGPAQAAKLVERTLSALALAARARGIRRFVVAGGETSGAVAQALGAERLAIGPSIAPGVPWCATLGDDPLALTLKSGNFGAETFFADAVETAP